MEFGKVQAQQIDLIDFNLPADGEFTKQTLQHAPKAATPMQVHVGCAKWGRKEWVGQIYPPKTKEADFLTHYAQHFDSIELNATFYQVYGPERIAMWKEKVASNPAFKFCPKFSQSISHLRRLKNADELTQSFYQGIAAFGDKLGALFLQLSDTFTPKSFTDLELYLHSLPPNVPVFVELRHPQWFAQQTYVQQLFSLLQSLGMGAVITDASGRRDCVHMQLPTPQAFIRFVGNGLHPTDYSRIDQWVARIAQWQQQGLQQVWFFMHQHDEQYSPQLTHYLVSQLNQQLGLSLRLPQFIAQQQSLF